MGEERTISILGPGMDHLKTEDGAKRFNAAVEQRNQADYQCFLALRDISETGIFRSKNELVRLFQFLNGSSKEEALEEAAYVIELTEDALEARKKADREFSDALYGRTA